MISAKDKYINHALFAHCIEITVPFGFNDIFDKLVKWIDDYNIKNKTFIGFAQVKLKFGLLTIYVEHYTDNHRVWREDQKSLGWPDYFKIKAVQEHIADVCEASRSICKVCGKQKTESVVASKVKLICFDHMQNENEWWKEK